MLTWNRRDSTPLFPAPRGLTGDQGWIFWSYKSLSGLPVSGPYRIFVLVFNWNHFEMRFLNLRINFYLLRTLPKQKWTMNELLIFFKIQGDFKNFRDWSCIYKNRNEQRMKHKIFFKMVTLETILSKTLIFQLDFSSEISLLIWTNAVVFR